MEPQRISDNNTGNTTPANPALKWLYLGIAGIIICVLSLGIHFFKGSSEVGVALPQKVMSQVFGFSPYYFLDNNAPDNYTLDTNSPKFIGNALTFTLSNTKKEVVTVTQKALPSDYRNLGESEKIFDVETGNAVVGGPKKGKNTGSLATKDKTLISIQGPDTVDSSTIEDMLRTLVVVPKGLDAIQARPK